MKACVRVDNLKNNFVNSYTITALPLPMVTCIVQKFSSILMETGYSFMLACMF